MLKMPESSHGYEEKRMSMKSAFAVVLALLSVGVAQASEKTVKIGTFKDWDAYSYQENGHPVCYMLSHPVKNEGDYVRRGDVYAAIAHRPGEGRLDEISLIAGYTFRKDSQVSVRIGKKKFSLFSDSDTAWARDAATDKDIAAAMRAGDFMVVVGTSSRGTKTTDTYSLKGATAAWRAISSACGVAR